VTITSPDEPTRPSSVHCWACYDDADLAALHREDDEMAYTREIFGTPPDTADYHLTFSFNVEDDKTALVIADYVTAEIRKRLPIDVQVTFQVR